MNTTLRLRELSQRFQSAGVNYPITESGARDLAEYEDLLITWTVDTGHLSITELFEIGIDEIETDSVDERFLKRICRENGVFGTDQACILKLAEIRVPVRHQAAKRRLIATMMGLEFGGEEDAPPSYPSFRTGYFSRGRTITWEWRGDGWYVDGETVQHPQEEGYHLVGTEESRLGIRSFVSVEDIERMKALEEKWGG